MKHIIICILDLTLAIGLYAEVLTCYDIQYTEDPSGNSPYSGRTVTVRGIVVVELFYTGTNVNNIGFFISDPDGGPWSGLLIYSNQFHPQRFKDLYIFINQIIFSCNYKYRDPSRIIFLYNFIINRDLVQRVGDKCLCLKSQGIHNF